MREIETMEQWNKLSSKLTEHGYTLWQMQYGAQKPEGFHARFWKPGMQDNYEIVTHNEQVEDAISRFNRK